MTRATFTIAVGLLCGTVAAQPQSPVTFESPCSCYGEHVKGRLSAKNDPARPPADASVIQAVTPSDVYGWLGADARLMSQSERTGIENKWFALTGRVVDVRIEMDGDLHIALQDATGNRPGIVVVEIPAKPQWCEMRQTVFGWTRTRFPFQTTSMQKLNLVDAPTVTVIGKAFFDISRALQGHFNRRKHMPGYAAWEIHPVMKIEVQS